MHDTLATLSMDSSPSLGILLGVLRGFSCLLHLLLLLVLSFVYTKFRACTGASSIVSNERFKRIETNLLSYKQPLFCFSFCIFVFNLFCCLYISYSYWSSNGSSLDESVTLLDLAFRTLLWAALSLYLRFQFFNLTKSPLLLRVWCGLYLLVYCYCVVLDIVPYKLLKNSLSKVQFLACDALSVFMGLFLCYLGFLKMSVKSDDHNLLQEPLLNQNGNSVRRDDSITPYSNAGLLSVLTFSWMGSLIALGNKRTLDPQDIPQLQSGDSAVRVFPVFRNKLKSDNGLPARVSPFNLVNAMFLSAWEGILWTGLLSLLSILASYVGPFLIDAFVRCLNDQGEFKNKGHLLASAFIVSKIIDCLSQRNRTFKLQQIEMRIREALVAIIYNKSLTISCQSKQSHTSGEIINIMSVDAEQIAGFSLYMHDPWKVVIQIGLALFILYKNLGIASISTLLVSVIFMLINFPLGRLIEKFQEKLMTSKDLRMKATSEILRNMRILKLQAWEMKYLSKIFELRKTEVGCLKKLLYTSSVVNFIFWCASPFVSAATFGTCVLVGIPLESGKVLSALATFKLLQEPINSLPMTISTIIQTKVSICRIASFLCLDDVQTDVIEEHPRGSCDTAIEIADGNFSWDLSAANPTLKDVNLKVLHNMKVAVCGTVGCGKSSLLSSILGEVPKISGSVKLCGSKAYVAQSPWIQSGTIEENILFGKEMDRERYESILEACSLKKDCSILPFGDQTVIGERGINLSGGQKQRIQIARALYQDADIYLFDDPFSAVDAHTGSHLFKEVLQGLLSSKSVVYVTHQVEFLPAADLILVMRDGRITQAGEYNEILNSGSDFTELVGAHSAALSALDSRQISGQYDDKSNTDDVNLKEESNQDLQNGKPDGRSETSRQLIKEEEREKGVVGFSVYKKYLTAVYGGALVPIILLLHVLFQILQIGSNYWMTWATPMSKEEKPIVSYYKLIIVYVALAFGSPLCILVRTILLETTGYKAATVFFNKMHLCIFRAPMSFFDGTPSGRILDRCSSDQNELDMEISYRVWVVAFTTVNLLGTIAVMSRVAWQILVVFIPLISAGIWYQKYSITSTRELSRLIGPCKAPVIQHLAETISGSTTIRSFNQQSRFLEVNMKLIDAYSRPNFHSNGAVAWLGFRLDMFSSITFAFCLFFLIAFPEGIDPAMAGLAVTYGLGLNTLQASVIWNICNLENRMISVERILQYMSIPSEPALFIDENQSELSWPSHGEINVANLQIRYAPHLPIVLRGLTCTFSGGKKSGIVGRTGSGKSTLIQALFRIVEPVAGQIVIDGINISSMGLHDLRSRLSIIPQDPTMFEGTVRSNLDPLESYTDEQIWEALDKCQLGDEVRKKEKQLNSIITENGENWSMGQRQLICLGRVLLKKSKILVLDEATASVDTVTDNLIQQTVRQHFSDCTVLTIAHRISSILDSDMVLLLRQGLIEEYDTPGRLLATKSSSFAKLVAEYIDRSNKSS